MKNYRWGLISPHFESNWRLPSSYPLAAAIGQARTHMLTWGMNPENARLCKWVRQPDGTEVREDVEHGEI